MKRLLTYTFILCHFTLFAQYDLTIEVDNIKEEKGTVVFSVYSNSKDFLKQGKEYISGKIKVVAKFLRITVSDMPEGDYAVAIFQDLNDDGDCNVNKLGVPKEPYGFSTNYKPTIKAPVFKTVSFCLDSNRVETISLVH